MLENLLHLLLFLESTTARPPAEPQQAGLSPRLQMLAKIEVTSPL